MQRAAHILMTAGLTLTAACGSAPDEKEALTTRIRDLEKFVYGGNAATFNTDSAAALTQAYEDYAAAYPADSVTGSYLFSAGEVCITLRQPQRAIGFYRKLYTDYPDHVRSPYALFLEAFTYETQLNDTAGARRLYEAFIEKHPGHEFADDAQGSLDNLGIPVEELIKRWEEQGSLDSVTAN